MSKSFGSGAGEVETGSQCSWKSKFSLLRMLRLLDLQVLSVVPEKQLRIGLNRIDPF